MFTFKIKSTTFKVKTTEKQAAITDYCAKITKRTGRKTAEKNPAFSSNPTYPKFYDGMSANHYVREYERINDRRFAGRNLGVECKGQSLFTVLSTNPQFKQDDTHVEEPIE